MDKCPSRHHHLLMYLMYLIAARMDGSELRGVSC
jgi:hypothetical protein